MGSCAVSGAWEREPKEAEAIHSPQYRYVKRRKKHSNPGIKQLKDGGYINCKNKYEERTGALLYRMITINENVLNCNDYLK